MVDEILFRKAVKGDKSSFIKLIEPIKGDLYKVAFVYLRNEDDALDCIHETIIKGIKHLKTLKDPKSFNSWISRILVNECKDLIKKNSKVFLVNINEYENNLVSKDNDFEIKDEINTALNKLSDNERELIVMRYLEDKSLKSISEEKDVPLGTVKSRINRTLKKLRGHMVGV